MLLCKIKSCVFKYVWYVCLCRPYIPFCDPGRFGGRGRENYSVFSSSLFESLILSLSLSLFLCLSVCLFLSLSLSLSPLFSRLLFFKFISSDLHSTVEWYLFCAAYQRFHQKITLFLFFYGLVYCNFFVWNYCVPIYACLLVVCPFACFLVVLYWPWTLNLLCLYVHIQRWVQRVVTCAYVRHVPILA